MADTARDPDYTRKPTFMSESAAIAANWYPDPSDGTQLRWWDGAQWTEHTAPAQPAEPDPAQAPQIAVDPAQQVASALISDQLAQTAQHEPVQQHDVFATQAAPVPAAVPSAAPAVSEHQAPPALPIDLAKAAAAKAKSKQTRGLPKLEGGFQLSGGDAGRTRILLIVLVAVLGFAVFWHMHQSSAGDAATPAPVGIAPAADASGTPANPAAGATPDSATTPASTDGTGGATAPPAGATTVTG
ncbi:MAG: hypothetical protein JWN41_1279 [Thermoleophilia bacterium]|nr:hypothetical protein [Thermoleophilia bacterium]